MANDRPVDDAEPLGTYCLFDEEGNAIMECIVLDIDDCTAHAVDEMGGGRVRFDDACRLIDEGRLVPASK